MSPKQHAKLDVETAQSMALQGLAYLLGEPGRLSRFMALTGLQGGDLREAAESPASLAPVLEYLLADESLLLAFCAEAKIDPTQVAPALALLSNERI